MSSNIDIATRDIVAGAVGGGVGLVASQPFDTVKSRIQAQVDTSSSHNYTRNSHHRLMYRNGLDCFIKTLRTEGVRPFTH
jgi:hypothetical protein